MPEMFTLSNLITCKFFMYFVAQAQCKTFNLMESSVKVYMIGIHSVYNSIFFA